MKNYYYYRFEGVGKLRIAEEDGNLTDLHFDNSEESCSDFKIAETYLHREVYRQLEAYFTGKLKKFSIPLAPEGTNFQLLCWNELLNVPYGETRSYGEIARAIGSPKGFRAVGMANNRNPIAIIIPCHRIIGSDGRLVGFGGGLNVKEFLLKLEQTYAVS